MELTGITKFKPVSSRAGSIVGKRKRVLIWAKNTPLHTHYKPDNKK
jgi:hypothetical protein